MNFGPLIFLGAFFALATSWFGFVLGPQLQVGRMEPGTNLTTKVFYPQGRAGLARQGLDVYRAYGCATCHSQQVAQDGAAIDVVVTEMGTNQAKVVAALIKIGAAANEGEAKARLATLPAAVRRGVPRNVADSDTKILKAAGAKANIWIVPVGPELERGWGKRRTVADDFLFDSPALAGSQRIGPDLANVGVRRLDADWHLRHLYAPQLEVKGSLMPPFRFLFDTRRIGRSPSPYALKLPADLPPKLAPPAGYEIVPTEEAQALVAYLLSLRVDAPLFVAPFSESAPAATDTNAPPGAATNAPAGSTP